MDCVEVCEKDTVDPAHALAEVDVILKEHFTASSLPQGTLALSCNPKQGYR